MVQNLLKMLRNGKLSWLKYVQARKYYGQPVDSFVPAVATHSDSTTDEHYEKLLETLDPMQRRVKRRIEAEIEQLRSMSPFLLLRAVPARSMYYLVTSFNTYAGRRSYLMFLHSQQLRFDRGLAKNKLWKDYEQSQRSQFTSDQSQHPISELQLRKSNTFSKRCQYGCYRSMVFGAPLILDMDYHMTPIEEDMAISALMDLCRSNMSSSCPYHLHIAGFKPHYWSSHIMKRCNYELHASLLEGEITDVFDGKDLIYLTPSGGKPLVDYDPQNIYVIRAYKKLGGATYDHHRSLARARKLGINQGTIQFEDYWGTYHQKTLEMLLEVGLSHSWSEAAKTLHARHSAALKQRQHDPWSQSVSL